jgi:TonB family protein
MKAALVFFALLISPLVHAEDERLRARAEQLLNQANLITMVRNPSATFQTVASFQATADDGTLKTGTYTRLRGPSGVRQQIQFGDWSASRLVSGTQIAMEGPWERPPFAVRWLLRLVPFSVGTFDSNDVIREIRESSALGEAAVCVEFDTVTGERKDQNEICFSKQDGRALTMTNGKPTYAYTRYTSIGTAQYPRHIELHDGANFVINIDQKLSALTDVPADAFTRDGQMKSYQLCKTGTAPVPIAAPKPEPRGGPDAPVTEVAVAVRVTAAGTVENPQIIHPNRSDLDAEALALASRWTFQPATCDNHLNNVTSSIVFRFQGW